METIKKYFRPVHFLLMIPTLFALLLALNSCAPYPRADSRKPYYKTQPKHYRPWAQEKNKTRHRFMYR
jgi:hypothetical protein